MRASWERAPHERPAVSRCPACHRDAPDGARVCPHGAAPMGAASGRVGAAGASDASDASPTRTVREGPAHGGGRVGGPGGARDAAPAPRTSTPRPISGGIEQGRFLPGALVAERYRIFGLV